VKKNSKLRDHGTSTSQTHKQFTVV